MAFDIETITTSGIGVTAIIIAAIIFSIIIGVGVWVYLNKVRIYKQFKVIIWEKDGFGQLTEKYDQGGIFVDKDTKNKLLFLKKANVGLKPDNIPYLPTSGKTPVIYLLQTGLKNFRFINPEIDDQHISFTVSEEDINWAVNAYEKQKQLFATSWLMQYLPFIMLAFVCMIILILFVYLFRQFPLIKEMMVEMKEIAKALAMARSGTTVI